MFQLMAKCVKKKDFEGCVQVFRQWHALLMGEQHSKIDQLKEEMC